MSNFVPDIPVFAGVGAGVEEKANAQYSALKKKYRMVLRNRAALFKNNIQAYLDKRPFSKDPSEKLFKKIFKDANFIMAYPDRYAVGGMDLPHVETFMLHRPGDDAASCLIDNVIAEFSQKNRKASTHFITGQDGQIVQMVDLADTAWHTGDPTGKYPNHRSVGVEMEGGVGEPISEQLYRATASLIARVSLLSAKFAIDEAHIIEHRRVLPTIKRDVGAPIQIPKLIELAKQLVPTYSKDDLFKQLSTGDSVQAAMAAVTALSAVGSLSPADISTLQAMASNTEAMQRSVGFASYSRSDMATTAAQQNASRSETEAQLLAFQLSLTSIKAKPKPQANVAGILFDMNTGLYNDGRTQ